MDEKEVTSKPKLSDKRLKLPLSSPLMDTRQLIDALPSYISLYNNSTSSRPSSNSNLDRPSVLKWFSSLTVHQRLSYLTIVDHSFAQLLLQMLSKLRLCGGHGSFIILPDLPSSESPYLPTLCFRKSLGLLARISDSNESSRLIRDSVRFFNSKEGESVRDCSCDVNSIDTVTFSDEFVVNVDRFVKAMDGVSDSGFLGSDWVEVGMDWVEFGWLKAKGYYSLEAFVANRVEVALKLAWLSSNNGKKRGVKLKEKASSVGVAANVYWRKKGCIDWWNRLGREVKSRVLWMVLGKTTKPLIGELLKGAEETVGDKMQFSCKPLILGCNVDLGLASMNHSPLLDIIYRLAVLQDIVAMMSAWQCDDFDGEKLFLSSLNSVNSISDYVSRKMRALLMVISLDSTKLELFEEKDLKDPPNKSKKKLGATGRKKKGKSQSVNKLNSATNHCNDKLSNGKSPKDNEFGCACNDTMEFVNCVKRVIPQEKDKKGHLSIADKKMDQGSTNKKVEVASKKYKKDSRKKKNSCRKIHASSSFQDSSSVPGDSASSLVAVRDDHKDLHRLSDDSGVQEMDTAIDKVAGSAEGSHRPFTECCLPSNEIKDEVALLETEKENDRVNSCGVSPETTGVRFGSSPIIDNSHSDCTGSTVLDSSVCNKADDIKIEAALTHGIGNKGACNGEAIFSSGGPSYEWPSVAPLHFPGYNSQHLPPATDRLHLEVGHNLYNHFQHSTIQQLHQARNSLMDGACGRILSKLPVSLDWPPLVRNINGLTSSLTCNYDPGFISRRQCALQQGFTKKNAHFSAVTSEDDRKYSADFVDVSDRSISQELADEYDSHWVSEEEYEMCAMPCIDYNQYFGGGIMYWNPSDYPAAGFSRPPSMSSDDSSWAWREADMNRTVDDMVSFSSSYTTNGLPSPSGAPFCSPFDSLGPGPQALGYVRPGNEISAKVLQSSSTVPDLESEEEAVVDGDAKSGDSLPYPVLRPIIIPNISRERSRSEFKRGHDLRSPCVPPNRREQPRIKRPPSPVVLCVPHAPRPPPPSPVGNSRKHRGFPTVRSGSSSPRHWGMRGWFHDGTSFEDTCVCVDGAEVVWPSWSNKTFSSHQIIQPIAGALLQDRLIAISQLTHDQDHPDVAFPLQPPDALNCPARKASLPMMHNLLHEEIECFCKKVAAENFIRRPYINWAVKRVTRSLQVLWPRSRTNVFGSNASGLSLPTSDVDLVVCLPPVRNLEPIKEAGILEGRNGIKETCLQHAARYLANQEWVKADSLKTVENTMIPIIMLVVEVPQDFIASAASNMQTPPATNHSAGEQCIYPDDDVSLGRSSVELSELNSNSKNAKSVRMDISFKSPSHTGLQTTELVKQLTEQFPAAIPLALVLKQFLADRSLDQAYSGGLSSYCLVLLIIRFLQHEHHLGRSINQNLGSLFMDFLYFFGNVFDPRQMRISIQGSGIYINRERGYSIDPIYIDDPLFVTNNVGKNCFRIHQCIKAFADAYSALENNLTSLLADDVQKGKHYHLLPKIIPSLGLSERMSVESWHRSLYQCSVRHKSRVLQKLVMFRFLSWHLYALVLSLFCSGRFLKCTLCFIPHTGQEEGRTRSKRNLVCANLDKQEEGRGYLQTIY